jgi:hypothetical protein
MSMPVPSLDRNGTVNVGVSHRILRIAKVDNDYFEE